EDGLNDIGWFDEKGTPMSDEAWLFSEGRLLVCRRICPCDGGALEATLLLMNASFDTYPFTMPQPAIEWRVVLDSAHPDRGETAMDTDTIDVEAHSAMLLVAKHGGAEARPAEGSEP